MSVFLKLLSAEGEVLGTVMVPDATAEVLKRHRYVEIAFQGPFPMRPFSDSTFGEWNPNVVVKRAVLVRLYSPSGVEGVALDGATVEEFELIHGCAFFPGAGWVRQVIAGLAKAE